MMDSSFIPTEAVEPIARALCRAEGHDPDEPMPPHGEFPRWFGRCPEARGIMSLCMLRWREVTAKTTTAKS